MKLIIWGFGVLLPALASVPSPATAQPDPKREALQHYDQAIKWMKEGAYLKAIPELERCYELGHDYMVLYDLGQAYLGLNQPVYAVDTLKKYLREGQARISSTERAKVDAEIARHELRVASLTVVADVKGAMVRFDGVEIGKTPIPNAIRVNAGTHRLTVEAKGYHPWERTLDLAGREQKVVKLSLEPERAVATTEPVVPPPLERASVVQALPGPAVAPTPPPNLGAAEASGSSAPEPALAASSSEASPASAGSATHKMVAYVVGGLGIGALAVGSVFGVRAITKQNDSDDLCPNGRCSQEAVRLNDQAKTAAWVSDFTIGAGLVAVGVAAYLLIRSPAPAGSPSHAMRVVPEVGPGQAGLALGGVW